MKNTYLILMPVLIVLVGCTSQELNSGNESAADSVGSQKKLEFKQVSAAYDSVSDAKLVAGKLSFTAYDGDKRISVYDSNEYTDRFPFQVGDEVAFMVTEGDKKFIEYRGEEIGEEYDTVTKAADLNGKLLFTAKNGNRDIVVYDREVQTGYDSLAQPFGISSSAEPIVVEGKLAFPAKKNGKTVVIYSNSVLGGEYEYVSDLKDIGGKVGFVGTTSKGSSLVLDGETVYEADKINNLIDAGGKPAFITVDEENLREFDKWGVSHKNMVILDGKRIGKSYDSIKDSAYGDGKLAFVAWEINKTGSVSDIIMVIDGQELEGEYKGVSTPQLKTIGDKLAFTVSKNDEIFVEYGDQELGPYSLPPNILDLDGKPALYR